MGLDRNVLAQGLLNMGTTLGQSVIANSALEKEIAMKERLGILDAQTRLEQERLVTSRSENVANIQGGWNLKSQQEASAGSLASTKAAAAGTLAVQQEMGRTEIELKGMDNSGLMERLKQSGLNAVRLQEVINGGDVNQIRENAKAGIDSMREEVNLADKRARQEHKRNLEFTANTAVASAAAAMDKTLTDTATQLTSTIEEMLKAIADARRGLDEVVETRVVDGKEVNVTYGMFLSEMIEERRQVMGLMMGTARSSYETGLEESFEKKESGAEMTPTENKQAKAYEPIFFKRQSVDAQQWVKEGGELSSKRLANWKRAGLNPEAIFSARDKVVKSQAPEEIVNKPPVNDKPRNKPPTVALPDPVKTELPDMAGLLYPKEKPRQPMQPYSNDSRVGGLLSQDSGAQQREIKGAISRIQALGTGPLDGAKEKQREILMAFLRNKGMTDDQIAHMVK